MTQKPSGGRIYIDLTASPKSPYAKPAVTRKDTISATSSTITAGNNTAATTTQPKKLRTWSEINKDLDDMINKELETPSSLDEDWKKADLFHRKFRDGKKLADVEAEHMVTMIVDHFQRHGGRQFYGVDKKRGDLATRLFVEEWLKYKDYDTQKVLGQTVRRPGDDLYRCLTNAYLGDFGDMFKNLFNRRYPIKTQKK